MFNYPYGDSQQINLNWIISEIIALHQRLDPDYTAPTFTQIYPFSDTQQLNLDWILTELKALKDLAPTPPPAEEIDEIGQALIAGAYDADTSYQKNDYIVQDGKVYRANAATTGTFDPTKWNEVLLGNDLAIITRWADATNTFLNSLAASNVANDSSVTGTTVTNALNNLNGAITSLNSRYPTDTYNTLASLISAISQNNSESVGMCSITSVLMLQLSGVGRPATLIWKYLPITGYDEIEYFVFNDAIEAYGYIKLSTSTVSRVWASKYIAGDTITRRFIQAAGRIVNAKNGATLGVVLDKPIASGTSLTITFSTGDADNFYPATPELYTVMRNADTDINTLIDKNGNITILSQREDGTLLITVPFIATLSAATASSSGVVGLIEANLDITFS